MQPMSKKAVSENPNNAIPIDPNRPKLGFYPRWCNNHVDRDLYLSTRVQSGARKGTRNLHLGRATSISTLGSTLGTLSLFFYRENKGQNNQGVP
jgi:hypothetical protein